MLSHLFSAQRIMITESPLHSKTRMGKLARAVESLSGGPIQSAITYEKIPTHIYADAKDASRAVAQEIAEPDSSETKRR